LSPNDHLRIEDTPKRVRVYLQGQIVADSTHCKLVWEIPPYPTYYFPEADVRLALLAPSDRVAPASKLGQPRYFHVKVGDRQAADAAWRYPDSEPLRGFVRLQWDAMDAWFEEEEEVFVHAHDPYKRIDILHGSRHVQVSVDGVELADTQRPTLLFETSLPVRYYVPKLDVRMELLTPTDKRSGCAYKGFACYWSVRAGPKTYDNLVWSYPTPIADCAKIAGLVCFLNEKVDLRVDGVLQERPVTEFANRR
jgi:uncharacterized protein (DUF427 family)